MRKEISFSESEAYTLRSITLNLEAVEQEPFATGWARVQDDLFGYIFSLTANREVCRPKFTLEIQQFWMHRDLGAEKIRLQLEGYEPLRPDFLIETKKVEDFDHANEICALANFFIFKVENATLVSNAKSLKELELYDQWDLSDAPDYPHDFGGDKFTDEDNMRLIAEKGLRIIAWDDETVLTLDFKGKISTEVISIRLVGGH